MIMQSPHPPMRCLNAKEQDPVCAGADRSPKPSGATKARRISPPTSCSRKSVPTGRDTMSRKVGPSSCNNRFCSHTWPFPNRWTPAAQSTGGVRHRCRAQAWARPFSRRRSAQPLRIPASIPLPLPRRALAPDKASSQGGARGWQMLWLCRAIQSAQSQTANAVMSYCVNSGSGRPSLRKTIAHASIWLSQSRLIFSGQSTVALQHRKALIAASYLPANLWAMPML